MKWQNQANEYNAPKHDMRYEKLSAILSYFLHMVL